MKKLLILALAIVLFTITGEQASRGGMPAIKAATPLPDNVEIIPPDPSLGIITECSGVLEGKWDNPDHLDFTVVIEQITPTEAKGVYSYGNKYGGGTQTYHRSSNPRRHTLLHLGEQ